MARDRTLGIAVNELEEKVIREVARREGYDSVSPFLRELVLPEVVALAREHDRGDDAEDETTEEDAA